jgi:hypothetical protein
MTPEEVERRTTLSTAVTRYEQLRMRDSFADPNDFTGLSPEAAEGEPDAQPLSQQEALELLALGEVIARKAGYGRQLAVRTARAAGASWAQIGQALGQTRQSAWEAHRRWIDGLARDHERSGVEGLDAAEASAARRLAGTPEEDA